MDDDEFDAKVSEVKVAMAANEKRKRYLEQVLSILAGAAALFAAVIASGAFQGLTTLSSEDRAPVSQVTSNPELLPVVLALRQDVAALQRAQTAFTELPESDRAAAQISEVAAKLDALEKRQASLEEAIMSNPEKALTVPLMRRDLDNMRDSNAQSLTAVKQSVDQVYDLTKWLLGALAIGVLSLAIANFLTKK